MKIKDFKSNIFTWLNEPKWLNRLTLYFALGAVIITTLHIFLSYSGFLHTDVDSARYMLSALVHGEAAIVALVVTLSLVAVQLAAQSYSARVVEVFRRTPDLWILMGIYGVAIFYGLGVLKLIERANPQVNGLANLEGQVAFSYYLGVFSFVALVPYIWNTLNLLKPSTVISMLAEKITKQSILSAIGDSTQPNVEKDPIQPIIDIVHGALMRYDYATVRTGLRAIGNSADNTFEKETFVGNEEFMISRHIFDHHLTRVGKLAIIKEDEDSTVEVITNLRKIGITTAKQKLEFATGWVIISLRVVGIAAADRKIEWPTIEAVNSLGEVGKVATEHEAQQAELSLKIIEEKFSEQNENLKWWIKESIRKIQESSKN